MMMRQCILLSLFGVCWLSGVGRARCIGPVPVVGFPGTVEEGNLGWLVFPEHGHHKNMHVQYLGMSLGRVR